MGGGVTQSSSKWGSTPSFPMGGTPIWLTRGTHQDWLEVPLLSGLDGGTPLSGLDGGPANQDWMVVTPPPHLDWMAPLPIRRQSSRVSTCYTAGGMPRAFTQEDFLVLTLEWSQYCSYYRRIVFLVRLILGFSKILPTKKVRRNEER